MRHLRAILIILALAGCNRREESRAAVAARSTLPSNQSETDSTAYASLRPGFYLAPWNDGYQTRWLLLYVNGDFETVTYVAAEVAKLCTLKVWDDSVRFTTDELPFWQTGDRFTFTFVGTRTPTGLDGNVLMNGRPYDQKVFSTQFRFYASAGSAAGDTSFEGLYGAVEMDQESGDLLGDELLLVRTAIGLAAFYTNYEGVPVGPYLSDSTSIHGDTIRVTVPLFAPRPSTPITFIVRRPTSRRDGNAGTPDDISEPRYVAKRASVAETFTPSTRNHCGAQSQRSIRG